MIVGYDHVQVAIPSGAEPVARGYYGGLLGMIELPKPATLAARGGWTLCCGGPTRIPVRYELLRRDDNR